MNSFRNILKINLYIVPFIPPLCLIVTRVLGIIVPPFGGIETTLMIISLFPCVWIGTFWIVVGLNRKAVLTSLSALMLIVLLNVILFFMGILYCDDFAPNFSEDRYAQIRIGMDSTEIKQILGEPLREFVRETDSLVYVYVFCSEDEGLPRLFLLLAGINALHEYGSRRVVLSNSSGKVLYKDPTN